MSTKTYTFDELPAPDITLDLSYIYTFRPGRTQGLPENCYPEEEECEVKLPEGFEKAVMTAYIMAARQAMKEIESRVMDLEFDMTPRQWAEEQNKNL
jgi:hypothetical protein